MRPVIITFLLLTLATVGVLGFRGRVNENRPLMLVPDMDFQPRYNPQSESVFFGDGRTMRTPPAGTIAFGGNDYFSDSGRPRLDPDFAQLDDRFYRGKSGKDFIAKAPIEIDLKVLKRGRERFNINCSPCHGRTGDGKGIVTQYGLVGVPSYHDDRLRKITDGEIFHVITNGKGLMSPYQYQIKPADRWAIVAYVRALQLSQNATLADVPEERRGEVKP